MLWNGVLWIKFSSSTMEFYGSMEAKDQFGVVGRFGFRGCGFMGVLCCSKTQDQWWWWLQRIGLGWWVGLDLWLWIYGCVVLLWNPKQVVVVVAKDRWLCWLCCCDGPHGEASGAKPRSVLMVKPRLFLMAKPQVVGVVKPRSVPTAKPHLYLSSIMLYWEFWWVFGKEMVLDNNFGWIYNWFLWKNLDTNFGILWVSILLFLCLNILGCCSYVFMIKMNTNLNWFCRVTIRGGPQLGRVRT